MEGNDIHSNFVRLRSRTPALREINTTPLRAVVAAHAAAAVALTPEGVTPAVAAGAPFIVATAVAPAPLGSAPVLHMLAPVVRVVVAVPKEARMGLAGPRANESISLISSKDPAVEGSARRRRSRGDPRPPKSGEPGSRPSRRPPWLGTSHAKPPLLDKPEHWFKRSICARTKGTIRGRNNGDKQSTSEV